MTGQNVATVVTQGLVIVTQPTPDDARVIDAALVAVSETRESTFGVTVRRSQTGATAVVTIHTS